MFFARCILLLSFPLFFQGCAYFEQKQSPWKAAVNRHTSQLGYRNWIVIAEASFPALNRTGIGQVSANVEIPEALDYVLKIIDESQNVKPAIYFTKESQVIENNQAPGMDQLRERLAISIRSMETTKVEQDSLIAILQDVNRSFDVLIVRTTSTLPYSSVFLELQPGYWDAEAEEKLRQRMTATTAPAVPN
jgi:D-ribose pyranose/furanose isomerase RbsD